jgi:hypothetical protein
VRSPQTRNIKLWVGVRNSGDRIPGKLIKSLLSRQWQKTNNGLFE